MENASKALIMAGGILIALLVIGALMLMFGNLSSYQKSNTQSEKDLQLAAFNQEFAQYADSDIKGYDLISLINKVVDFNKKDGITNYVDYDKKITVKITLGSAFANKYGVNGDISPFNTRQYSIQNSNNDFHQIISSFSTLEQQYTLGVMSKLSANYDSIVSGTKTIKEVAGRDIQISPNDIEQYRIYSEFKSATFTTDGNPKYKDGQIVELAFKFLK